MKWQIALGTLSIAALAGLFAILALGEQGRMATFTSAYEARQVESGAALFENSCRPCHGPQGKGVPGLAPSINAADLFNGQRLASVGYAGTLEDYLRSVIAAGRPVPSAGANYPNRMPTWGQEFGGPLRSDQIDALVTFIANWEERALAEAVPTPIVGQTVGTDISVPLPAGDTAAGKALAEGGRLCGAMDLQVYLIEEHTQVREALAERLSNIEGVELVGQAGDAQDALREVERLRPQVILIESKREDGLGLELVRQAARSAWNPQVVVLTTYEVAWERRAVRRAGAHEYLLKEIDSAELLKRIQALPPRNM